MMKSIVESRSMLAFASLVVLALGFGLPAVLVYLNVFYGLDIWFVGFFTLMSLAAAAAILTVLMESTKPASPSRRSREEIGRFRETQIDLLKDLDNMIEYLGKIRDQLRVEV